MMEDGGDLFPVEGMVLSILCQGRHTLQGPAHCCNVVLTALLLRCPKYCKVVFTIGIARVQSTFLFLIRLLLKIGKYFYDISMVIG